MNITTFRAKALLVTALLAATICARAAEVPADGLYLAAPGAPAAEFRTEDGQTVFLGAKQNLQLVDKWISFRGIGGDLHPQIAGNWEATFNLQLTTAYDDKWQQYVLVVAGIVYRQSGAAASNNKTSSLHFGIWGDEHARQVAGYLGIAVQYPTHPGHRLRVWFTPDKPSFARGEPVTVTLHIVNLGAEPVRFMTRGRSGPQNSARRDSRENRDNQFVFAAYRNGRSVPDVGWSTNADVLSYAVVLQPGATFTDSVSLESWFELAETGQYQVHGSYLLDLLKPEGGLFDATWKEYVSGDFTVRIH